MTRPHIVRADSIDLQDPDAPSAKDHKNATNGQQPVAPHQAETLREVAAETKEERRISWANGDIGDLQQYAEEIERSEMDGDDDTKAQQRDALAISLNGGSGASDDGDDMDTDGEGDMDDDMMDKISSSPSIEDADGQDEQDDDIAWENVEEEQQLTGSTTSALAIYDAVSPTLECAYMSDACTILGVREYDSIISPYNFLVPYHSSDDDDDDDDFSLHVNSRYVDSGWGGECLQDTEDIDFEFVYALHTFVATVEGQANATKGDTMVLLDDSNSYWWLVRVVKDSSIGYLPAEHIETPTERLARLNKHRNIDLAATMLGDQAEKTKNPLKSAMKRRKAKNVTFTAPTYVDYSDFDYSTEEEDADGDAAAQQQGAKQEQAATATGGGIEDDESARVEPLKPRSLLKHANPEEGDDAEMDEDDDRASDEIFDNAKGTRTTKNGTVRNTDSFFKDETVETKKITLTPNLLRDDGEARESTDSAKELRQRPSFEKELVADKKDEKKKKDKKEKDKKPSAIRSFFSRKDKKKSTEDDDESFGKRSMDVNSVETVDSDTRVADVESPDKSGPQRSVSKLQKQQARTEPSPTRKPGSTTMELAQFINSESRPPNNVANTPPTSLRMVEADPADSQKGLMTSTGKPQKLNPAKNRVELDDFDTSEEEEDEDEDFATPAADPAPTPALAPAQEQQKLQPQPKQPQQQQQRAEEKQQRPTLPGSYPDSYMSTQTTGSQQTIQTARSAPAMERLSESPVHVSPIASNHPPALMGDNSSQEDRSSPISSPSPDVADVDSRGHHNQDSMTSTSATATTWNDDNLRAFFDSGTDIRDLLVVVYDKTDVPPAGPDHPIAGSLFREQNAKLAEITTVSTSSLQIHNGDDPKLYTDFSNSNWTTC
ncbi:Tip elongation aberrant protein Tea4 [Apiospora kogelbergensis]|uniref:Tip elongation aberrant protein Tea4 n=1 Tax=Apiospora kogelbergensis TaxID=1337665 RepID=UPI00312D8231